MFLKRNVIVCNLSVSPKFRYGHVPSLPLPQRIKTPYMNCTYFVTKLKYTNSKHTK